MKIFFSETLLKYHKSQDLIKCRSMMALLNVATLSCFVLISKMLPHSAAVLSYFTASPKGQARASALCVNNRKIETR